MRKLLVATSAFFLLGAAAPQAADFEAPDIYAPVAMDEAEWATFYVGIHGGGASGARSGCYDIGFPPDCATGADWGYDQSGLLLGAQLGMTFQITDSIFAGVEVDASLASIGGELNPGAPDCGNGTYNWLATGTAKLGYKF